MLQRALLRREVIEVIEFKLVDEEEYKKSQEDPNKSGGNRSTALKKKQISYMI